MSQILGWKRSEIIKQSPSMKYVQVNKREEVGQSFRGEKHEEGGYKANKSQLPHTRDPLLCFHFLPSHKKKALLTCMRARLFLLAKSSRTSSGGVTGQ